MSQERLFELEEPEGPRLNVYARHYWVTAPTPLYGKRMSGPASVDGINPAWLEWHWARGLDPHAPKRSPIPSKLRLAVIERDGYVCGLCGGEVEDAELHIDHVLPVARGGQNTLENLQVAHAFCNISKGARVPGKESATDGPARL